MNHKKVLCITRFSLHIRMLFQSKANNSFTGSIPSELGNIATLEELYLGTIVALFLISDVIE